MQNSLVIRDPSTHVRTHIHTHTYTHAHTHTHTHTTHSIVMVSCTTGVGIKELQERIHHAAISAVDYDTKEHIIGMQVCDGGKPE